MNYLYGATNVFNRATKQVEKTTKQIMTGAKKDKYKPLMELVKDYDYPIEKHYYETKDNYINCVFRISGVRGTKAQDNAKLNQKKPVIIY